MKKVLFLLSFLFVSFVSFSQTTEEEYKFVKYEASHNPNPLLEFRNLNDWKVGDGTVFIDECLREKSKISCYVMYYKNKSNISKYQLVIPSHLSNKKVLIEYFEDIKKLPTEIKDLYLYYIVFYLGFDMI